VSNWAPHWKLTELGELATFRNGINFGYVNRGYGIKVIGVSDFQNNFLVPYDDLNEINPLGVIRDDDLLKENDIVFVRSNGSRQLIGRSLFVKNLREKVTHSGFTIRLRFHSQKVHSAFYAQLFRSDMVRRELSQSGSGTNISNLNQQTLDSLIIPLPPLPEQRAIAAILSTWDEAITLTERLIAALRQRKQALMQILLTGEVRFPGFEGEWDEIRIGNAASLMVGGTPSTHRPEFWGGDIRWMNSGDIHQKRIYEVDGRITTQGLANSSAKMLPINSVLVALAGQGKTRGTVAINKVELSTNQSIAAIFPNSDFLDYEYLFYVLDARYEELRRLSTGDGGRGGLNLQILKEIWLSKPTVKEQTQIAEVLRVCDASIACCSQYIRELHSEKRGLMQQLLTGAIRVQVEE